MRHRFDPLLGAVASPLLVALMKRAGIPAKAPTQPMRRAAWWSKKPPTNGRREVARRRRQAQAALASAPATT